MTEMKVSGLTIEVRNPAEVIRTSSDPRAHLESPSDVYPS
jgi:hypothetical protein